MVHALLRTARLNTAGPGRDPSDDPLQGPQVDRPCFVPRTSSFLARRSWPSGQGVGRGRATVRPAARICVHQRPHALGALRAGPRAPDIRRCDAVAMDRSSCRCPPVEPAPRSGSWSDPKVLGPAAGGVGHAGWGWASRFDIASWRKSRRVRRGRNGWAGRSRSGGSGSHAEDDMRHDRGGAMNGPLCPERVAVGPFRTDAFRSSSACGIQHLPTPSISPSWGWATPSTRR